MKKLIFNSKIKSEILIINILVLFSSGSFAQTNTFPTTGNVGIGTSTPRSVLHVVGSVKLDSSLILANIKRDETTVVDDSTYYFLRIKSDGTIVAKKGGFGAVSNESAASDPCGKYLLANGTYSVVNPQWNNGLNKLFTACKAVYVGIGTTTPRVNLDVTGVTYSQKIYLGEANPTLGNNFVSPDFYLKSNNTGGNANATTFLVENRDRKLFQIQNDGLVRAREIKVDLATTWPDYVFHSTYSLMPLNDVKTFIGENGHLPNVPSACEIEEDGIPLGGLNRILLEKVEELTLYMIQMQEEQERLKAKLEELKTNTVER